MYQVNPLLESVNSKSDIYVLDTLSIKDRIKWCKENFDGDIGKGCGRITYKIPKSNLVLKLAYNYQGLIQNKNEYNFYYKCDQNPILAKCFEKGKNYNWLISELCYSTCDNDDEQSSEYLDITKRIKQLTGIDHKIFYAIVGLIVINDSRKILDDPKLKKQMFNFLKKVRDNSEELMTLRKSNQREKFLDVVHNKLLEPDLLRYSETHNKCLHYYFHTCVWYIRSCSDKELMLLFKLLDTKGYLKIEFIRDLINLSRNKNINSYNLRDSMHPANMGMVKRNGKDVLVLLDYGFEDNMRARKPGRK